MSTRLPIENGMLQGDLDADGYTINNLNLGGLLLTKASVGLGNVDNTSDDLKPLSQAMFVALAAKEASIPYGTTSQFLRGDKTWQTLGALAFEGGDTGQIRLSTIGSSATSTAIVMSRRHDIGASVSISQAGESATGTTLPGVNLANAGALLFDRCSVAVIKTNSAAPIIFGVNNARRMRLETGLNVGGDIDPGSGCVTAFGTITAGTALVSGGSVTALTGVFNGGITLGSTTLSALTGDASIAGGLTVGGASVSFAALATADPHVAGRVWRSTNDLKVSTG